MAVIAVMSEFYLLPWQRLVYIKLITWPGLCCWIRIKSHRWRWRHTSSTDLSWLGIPLNLLFLHALALLNRQDTSYTPHCTSFRNTLLVQKKLRTLIFCWTAFCFDYLAHLLWYFSTILIQCHNIYFHPEINFWLRFCIDDRRVEPFLQLLPPHPKDF